MNIKDGLFYPYSDSHELGIFVKDYLGREKQTRAPRLD